MSGRLESVLEFTREEIATFQKDYSDTHMKLTTVRQHCIYMFLLQYPYGREIPQKLTVSAYSDGAINYDADGFRFAFSKKNLDAAIAEKQRQLG
jgi:hypothetical protein